MQMTIAHRLQEAINGAGITSQSELARRSGVPQPTINRILNDVGRQGPSIQTLKKLAAACEVSFQWLAGGPGAERGASAEEAVSGVPEPDIEHLFVVAKTSRADETAGPVPIRKVRLRLSVEGTEFAAQSDKRLGEEIYLGKEWLQTRGYDGRALIALAMDGDSMEPGLYAEDILVVNLSDRQPHDGEVFVLAYEGTVLIRRLLRDAGRWWLCSDSAAQRRFPRKRYANSECSIIGRVVYRLSEKI
jgi:phage repressor protein C with HTH and peptisase S24 domain